MRTFTSVLGKKKRKKQKREEKRLDSQIEKENSEGVLLVVLCEISLEEGRGKSHYCSKPVEQEGMLLWRKFHPLNAEGTQII